MPAVEWSTIDTQGIFAPHELANMESVIDAVCTELGVTVRQGARRRAIANRVVAAYRTGSRQPLDMVHAGLAEPAAQSLA